MRFFSFGYNGVLVCRLSFRAGIYGTKTGKGFAEDKICYFCLFAREYCSGSQPHFFRLYEKSTKKVPGGCAHPLDSRGRRKTSASLRSAGFTAIVEFPQYVETQECAVFLYLSATAG